MRQARGFTLLELMVALGLSSTLMGLAVSNLKSLTSPIKDSAAQMVSYFKQVRARALSTTTAYQIYPISATRVGARYAASCAATTWTDDPVLWMNLPRTTHLANTTWSVCYTTRGITADAVNLALADDLGQSRTIEVLIGGSVREL